MTPNTKESKMGDKAIEIVTETIEKLLRRIADLEAMNQRDQEQIKALRNALQEKK